MASNGESLNPDEYVLRLSSFSRELPQDPRNFLKSGPRFFSPEQDAIKDVRSQYEEMFRHSVNKLVEGRHRQAFLRTVKLLKRNPQYAGRVRLLVRNLKKEGAVPTAHASILTSSLLDYLGVTHTTNYLEWLGTLTATEFRNHFSVGRAKNTRRDTVERNQLRAAKHFDRFSGFFDTAAQFKNFKFELDRYEREIKQINSLKVPGHSHHLIITEKPAFGSIYPSIFGGDNFDVHQITLPNGKKLIYGSITDLEGHAKRNRSAVNHTRNLLIGYQAATALNASSQQLEAHDGRQEFLRRNMAYKDQLLESNKVKATGLDWLFDPETGDLHYISCGFGHPLLFHPTQGHLLAENEDNHPPVDLPFGVYPQKPEEYTVHHHQLPVGGYFRVHTDYTERKAKAKKFDYEPQMKRAILPLMMTGRPVRQISQAAHGAVIQAFKGHPIMDDGRDYTARRVRITKRAQRRAA